MMSDPRLVDNSEMDSQEDSSPGSEQGNDGSATNAHSRPSTPTPVAGPSTAGLPYHLPYYGVPSWGQPFPVPPPGASASVFPYPPFGFMPFWGPPGSAPPPETESKDFSGPVENDEPPAKRKMYEPQTDEKNVWHLAVEQRQHMIKYHKDLTAEEIRKMREDCPRPSEDFLKPRRMDKQMWALLTKPKDGRLLDQAKEYDGYFRAIFTAAADVMGPLGRAWSDVHNGQARACAGEDPECDIAEVLTCLEQSSVLMSHLLYLIEQKRRVSSLKLFLKEPKRAHHLLREGESATDNWMEDSEVLFGHRFFTEQLKSSAKEDKSLLEVKKSLGHWTVKPKPKPQQPFLRGPTDANNTAQWGDYGKFGRQYPFHNQGRGSNKRGRGDARGGNRGGRGRGASTTGSDAPQAGKSSEGKA